MSPSVDTSTLSPELQAAIADLGAALASGDQAPHHTQMTRLNQKILSDAVMLKMLAKDPLPNAWESILVRSAEDGLNLARRVHNDAWSFSHAINSNMVISSQSGDTQGQAPQAPIRSAAADNLAAGAAPANRMVDTGGAVATNGVLSAMTGIATALAKQVDATVAPVVAQVVDLQSDFADMQATLAQILQAVSPPASAPVPASPGNNN